MLPDYGSIIAVVDVADIFEGDLPRTLPGAQRRFAPSAWAKRVGPFDPTKLGVVRLVRKDNILYISDGQHRVGAIREAGYTQLRAEVSEISRLQEAAAAFLGSNTNRPVGRRETTAVEITAEIPEWVNIMSAMEKNGFTLRGISDRRGQGLFHTLECDATLISLQKKGTLDRCLYIYAALGNHWAANGKPAATLKGFSDFMLKYRHVDDDDLINKLRKTNLVKLTQQSFHYQQSANQGASMTFVWTLVDAYNKGRTSLRLVK